MATPSWERVVVAGKATGAPPSSRGLSGDLVYLFSSIHAGIIALIAMPSFFTGRPGGGSIFTLAGRQTLGGGASLFFYQSMYMLLGSYAFGYYRIYKDGAKNQPLTLFLGGLGKSMFVAILIGKWSSGTLTAKAAASFASVDAVLSVYFLRDWLALGRPLAAK
eukprot:CAMPEP_0180226362 /NCGR_PEP_ID=MMETSP0987-20121128/23394_1 /TAXON_ID=697907 /ORGANISM="non described non described, Strain CCMP2293" /LENGTH=162 /DNA_ID=CAMNT_0022189893 /DNA_START=326 /DNA_END=814 /DNA_ORIENTATION=+